MTLINDVRIHPEYTSTENYTGTRLAQICCSKISERRVTICYHWTLTAFAWFVSFLIVHDHAILSRYERPHQPVADTCDS